jgi:Ca2+-binding RTX toxin-like protein
VCSSDLWNLHLAGAAGGTLTDTRTDRPLEGILAVVTDPSGFIVSGGLSDANGFYLAPGLSDWDAVIQEAIPHRLRFIDPNRAYFAEWWDGKPTLRQAGTFFVLNGYYTPLDAGLLMRLRCGGVRATIAGTPGADVIVGTEGPDVIHAQGGKDIVDGGGGDDIICGGAGADTLTGGEGADRLYGNIGADTLIGGNGDDVLSGGPGSDLIEPGAGANTIDGGPGRDTLSYSTGEAAVLVDLAAGAVTGWVGDVVAFIENVTGSPYDDTLTGDAGPNILRGLGGNDTLYGGEGDDRLFGGDGEDWAFGGPGANTCSAEHLTDCLP